MCVIVARYKGKEMKSFISLSCMLVRRTRTDHTNSYKLVQQQSRNIANSSGSNPSDNPLYYLKYQVPYKLSMLQKAFLLPYYGLSVLADPTKGDMLASIGDMTGESQLNRMHDSLKKTSDGRLLLSEKPLISRESLNYSKLRLMDENTLGKHYITFMDKHSFSPDDRSKVKYINDTELAYVMVRYRQVHDFWHVLVDLPPTVVGEVALKWYEWKLTKLPVCAISSLLGPLALSNSDKMLILNKYLPWIHRSNAKCNDMLCYRYELNLHKSIEDVRKELNIEVWTN